MLPATNAPGTGLVFALTALAAAMAMPRLVVETVPSERGEAVAWSVVSAALLVGSLLLLRANAHVESRERELTQRERACQAQRNATVFAQMLVLANGFSLVAFVLAIFWRDSTALRDALTMFAAFGALLAGWYFASTVAYAPLPRLRPPRT